MSDRQITQEVLLTFRQRHGKGELTRITEFLGRVSPIIKALETEPGGLILQDALAELDSLLEKVIQGKAERLDVEVYQRVLHIVETWSDRLNGFYEAQNRLLEG